MAVRVCLRTEMVQMHFSESVAVSEKEYFIRRSLHYANVVQN